MEILDALVLSKIISNLQSAQDMVSLSAVCKSYRSKILSLSSSLSFRVTKRCEHNCYKEFIVDFRGRKNGLCSKYNSITTKLVWSAQYKDGLLDGIKKIYDYNGIGETSYKQGKKDGKYILRERNGRIITICHYKDDLLDGKYTTDNLVVNYKKGLKVGWESIKKDKERHLYHYVDGKKDGMYHVKNDGTLIEIGLYKADDLVYKYVFLPDGRISSYTTGNATFTYYEDGRLKFYYEKSGYTLHGEYKEFSPEGENILLTNYLNNKVHGETKEYKDGILIKYGNYLYNKRHGLFLVYSNGVLVERKYYKEDKLDGWYERYKHGVICERSHYKYGKLHGRCKFYEKGVLYQYREYKDDILRDTYHPSELKYKDMYMLSVVKL